jgi:hypothetical protein
MVALATLKTPDGLLASPPVLGPGSLPATGWTAAIASRVGTSMPSVDRRDLTQVAASSASVPNGVWNVYFSVQALTSSGATVTAADTKPLAGWETPGGWIEQKDPGAPLDLPATVLSTWAAVRSMDAADQPIADRTVAAARTTLANCQGNTFVQVHLVEILTTARPQTSRSALQALARCPGARSTLDGARGVQNEVDLLTAFAEAKRSSLLGTADNLTSPERLAQLRQMLRPQPFMRYDPWWAFYALDGYVAAGGDAHQFDEIAEGLIELVDDQGIADQVGSPVVSAQGMFYAVRVVQAIGRDPHGLIDTEALLGLGQQA